MLQKKELKEMVKSELKSIALYSKFENLQKYIERDRKKMVDMLKMMVAVYNFQHKGVIFEDEIIREVLEVEEEIYNDLEQWYDICGYYNLALHLIYK